MLVACRLAGLSALGAHYAGVKLQAMRAEHGTTHQDHAGTSRAALDIEHRTSQRMGMRADGRPPVRLDIDIDTGNADGEDGPQGCPGARGRQPLPRTFRVSKTVVPVAISPLVCQLCRRQIDDGRTYSDGDSAGSGRYMASRATCCRFCTVGLG